LPDPQKFTMKGVISFLVASVFLLVLVSSAVRLSEREPDMSYQPLVAMHLQERAISAAFSDALSDAAGKALLASQASGAEAPSSVKAAVYLAALDFEAQIGEAGYEVAFWCGKPDEAAMQDASARMQTERAALLPEAARPLSDPDCIASFDVNLLRKSVRVSNAGFSIYSEVAEMGHAVLLPDGFEGDIDG